jgi:hypothetical protein
MENKMKNLAYVRLKLNDLEDALRGIEANREYSFSQLEDISMDVEYEMDELSVGVKALMLELDEAMKEAE